MTAVKTATFRFSTIQRVRYAETDNMGVAYHANYLIWFEVGRTELIRQLGLAYKDLEFAGLFLPVIEVHCEYLKAVRYDDEVRIDSFLVEQKGLRLKIGYELYVGDTLSARGFTIHAFTDRSGRPTRPLKAFVEAVDAVLE